MTSADFANNRDNFCYRHPDRQSFVMCQRCLRTICPECQTQAAVGVICPECMREQQKATPTPARTGWRRPRAQGSTMALARDSRPLVTYWIIGITVLVYVAQLIPGSPVQQLLALNSAYLIPSLGVGFEPWRLFTVLLVHGSFLHVGLNMLALWMIGRSLEPLLGHTRFLVLYLISGLGGSVAVALLAPATWVVGASGAIFGLFGALFVVGRRLSLDIRPIGVLIAINLALTFTLSGISWQGHVGGLVAGAALAGAWAYAPRKQRTAVQIGSSIVLAAIIVVIVIARTHSLTG